MANDTIVKTMCRRRSPGSEEWYPEERGFVTKSTSRQRKTEKRSRDNVECDDDEDTDANGRCRETNKEVGGRMEIGMRS